MTVLAAFCRPGKMNAIIGACCVPTNFAVGVSLVVYCAWRANHFFNRQKVIEIGVKIFFVAKLFQANNMIVFRRVSMTFSEHTLLFSIPNHPFFHGIINPHINFWHLDRYQKQDQHINALVSLNVKLMWLSTLLDRSHISHYPLSIVTCLLVSVVSNAGIIVDT